MTLTAHLHPLLVHFPIGLVLFAAGAETVAMATGRPVWRTAAVVNLRAGAAFAAAAAATGWRLAASMAADDPALLSWHRWIGTIAAIGAIGAALTTARGRDRWPAPRGLYQLALFGAAALVAITGHLGGLLVWGADFLRP
jgi:uncharacterized membrane protein